MTPMRDSTGEWRLSNKIKPQLFRLYCTHQYYANRDEYFVAGQTQPWTFREYVCSNLTDLKARYRAKRKVDKFEQ
jgi:hypothetical protein